MIFFAGFAAGIAVGAVIYRHLYTLDCNRAEIVCGDKEKDREIIRQMERLISYGNDM